MTSSGRLGRLGGRLRRRALARFVQHTQTEWARAGRVIHEGPVGAICAASLPGSPGGGAEGALGVVDGGLLFAGRRDTACDVYLPLDAVRWVALRRAARGRGGARRLAVHAERTAQWRVVVFALDEAVSFGEALAARAGQPLLDASAGREDFGPAQALRLSEDVYGDWHAGREAALYLAPDRLLFGWRDAIPLDAIEQVGVLRRATGRGTLLRVAYRVDDERYEVAGFEVPRAAAWAEAITARAGGTLTVDRKRKDEPPGWV